MRCIMADMDQKDSLLAVACARLVFAFGVCYTPWFDSGYMFVISLRGFLDAFFAFLREGHGRTGRFPWSLRFSSCSTLTRWSTSDCAGVVACPLCASTDAVVDVAVIPQRLVSSCRPQQLECWVVFVWALHTGAGPGVRVHWDTASIIRCIRNASSTEIRH